MTKNISIFFLALWSLMATLPVFSQKTTYLSRFEAVKSLELNIYHGDVHIMGSTSGEVEISSILQSPDIKPTTEMKDNKLVFTETSTLDGSNPYWPVWTLKVPQHIDLKLNISGGDLHINHVNGTVHGQVGAGKLKLNQIEGILEVNAGTGDIDLKDSKGTFKGNTGTGDIRLEQVKGAFNFNSGTGKVSALHSSVTEASQLNSGTGNVFFGGEGAVNAHLTLNSGTDNALIELGKLGFEGTLRLKCGRAGGRIEAPFPFDDENPKQQKKDQAISKIKKFGNADVSITVSSGLGVAAAR
jgi:hypothetical protein